MNKKLNLFEEEKLVEKYSKVLASGTSKADVARLIGTNHPNLLRREFIKLLIQSLDMKEATAQTYYGNYVKPLVDEKNKIDGPHSLDCVEDSSKQDTSFDELVSSIVDYIDNRLNIDSVESWVKNRYSWPKKTGKDSSWSRIKLYALYDKFFAEPNKEILPRNILNLIESNSDYACSDSLDWARHLLKVNHYNNDLLKEIKSGDIEFNYEQTKLMKERIASFLRETPIHTNDYLQAVSFFIKDWGGVTSNTTKKLLDYIELYKEFDINTSNCNKYFDIEGVATWSKYLSVIHPNRVLIYDARICFSLNAITFIYDLCSPTWRINKSGTPGSRNSKIILFEEYLINQLSKNPVTGDSFYIDYINLINRVADHYGDTVRAEHIEMMLFSIADEAVFDHLVAKVRDSDLSFYKKLEEKVNEDGKSAIFVRERENKIA